MSTLGTALYYPNFHMEPEWGKAALLYWDSLARIVPKAIQPTVDDEDSFSRELTKAKILTSIDTSDYVDEAARRFDQYLVPLFEKDPEITFDADYIAKVLDSCTSIHPMKLVHKLKNDLREMGVDDDESGFLKVPPQLGGPYMLCLGTVIKDQLKLPLLTDQPSFERIGEYLAFGAPTEDMEDPAKKALFRLGLPMPSAQSLQRVELHEILAFRDKRRPERLRLNAALETVMKEAAGIEDQNRLMLFWNSKSHEVDGAVDDYKRCLNAINLIDLASLFKVTVPTGVLTAIASGAGTLGPGFAVSLTAAAFVVDAGGVLGNRRFRRQSAEQKNPWLYALQVRHKFGSSN